MGAGLASGDTYTFIYTTINQTVDSWVDPDGNPNQVSICNGTKCALHTYVKAQANSLLRATITAPGQVDLLAAEGAELAAAAVAAWAMELWDTGQFTSPCKPAPRTAASLSKLLLELSLFMEPSPTLHANQ